MPAGVTFALMHSCTKVLPFVDDQSFQQFSPESTEQDGPLEVNPFALFYALRKDRMSKMEQVVPGLLHATLTL